MYIKLFKIGVQIEQIYQKMEIAGDDPETLAVILLNIFYLFCKLYVDVKKKKFY